MNFSQRKPFQTAVVYLYDPIPLEKVALDSLKLRFPRVVFVPEQELIIAESPEQKTKTQILTARLEFTDDSGTEFSRTDLSVIGNLLQAMPPLNVKAYGVNLLLRVVIADYENAGLYTTERFLSEFKSLEQNLGARIIASAHRLFYGEPANYFDLRLTPLEIIGEWLHLQLHRHKDIHLTDSERILQETVTGHRETIEELARLERIL